MSYVIHTCYTSYWFCLDEYLFLFANHFLSQKDTATRMAQPAWAQLPPAAGTCPSTFDPCRVWVHHTSRERKPRVHIPPNGKLGKSATQKCPTLGGIWTRSLEGICWSQSSRYGLILNHRWGVERIRHFLHKFIYKNYTLRYYIWSGQLKSPKTDWFNAILGPLPPTPRSKS